MKTWLLYKRKQFRDKKEGTAFALDIWEGKPVLKNLEGLSDEGLINTFFKKRIEELFPATLTTQLEMKEEDMIITLSSPRILRNYCCMDSPVTDEEMEKFYTNYLGIKAGLGNKQ